MKKSLFICLFMVLFVPTLCFAIDPPIRSGGISGISGGGFGSSSYSDCTEELKVYENRIQNLESTREDIGSWIKIFITSVSIMIALNIGISVLQVGGIAKKEVNDRLEGLREQINDMVAESEREFNSKVEDFNKLLDSMSEKVDLLEGKSKTNVDEVQHDMKNLKEELEDMLKIFKFETNLLKEGSESKIEKWFNDKFK